MEYTQQPAAIAVRVQYDTSSSYQQKEEKNIHTKKTAGGGGAEEERVKRATTFFSTRIGRIALLPKEKKKNKKEKRKRRGLAQGSRSQTVSIEGWAPFFARGAPSSHRSGALKRTNGKKGTNV